MNRWKTGCYHFANLSEEERERMGEDQKGRVAKVSLNPRSIVLHESHFLQSNLEIGQLILHIAFPIFRYG